MSEACFHADRRQSGVLFAVAAALTLGACGLGVRLAADWWLAGLAWFLALVFGSAAAILLYRLLAHPVMVRVSGEGVFIRRLGVTLPWAAIDHVERRNMRGQPLLAITETPAGHPVFDEQTVILGAALNEKAGLPPLAISGTGLDGSVDDIAAAMVRIGGVTVRDQA